MAHLLPLEGCKLADFSSFRWPSFSGGRQIGAGNPLNLFKTHRAEARRSPLNRISGSYTRMAFEKRSSTTFRVKLTRSWGRHFVGPANLRQCPISEGAQFL